MPLKYVEPEVFLIHRGMFVYHTYKDTITNRRECWFSTDNCEEDDDFQFDVRDVFHCLFKRSVPSVPEDDGPSKDEIIRMGLDQGYISVPLWQHVNKLGKLLTMEPDTKIIHSLIDFTCNTTAQNVKSLPVDDQLAFLISQLGHGTVEDMIRQTIKEPQSADKVET